MNVLLIAIVSIIVLYVVSLFVHSVTRWRFCALCVSVSLTWLWLLVAYFLGRVDDVLLIGTLMGGSAVGLMYMLVRRLPERFSLFRLPYLVSMVALVYAVLGGRLGESVLVALALLWATAIGIYLFRTNHRVARIAQKIIACCKNW